MASPIAGVWELVSNEEQGLFIATESYFTDVTVRKDREPFPVDRSAVTDEMRAEGWRGLLFAIGGTYEVLSSNGLEHEVLFHPLVNRVPIPSRDFTHQITVDGDTMSGEAGPNRREVWRRVARSKRPKRPAAALTPFGSGAPRERKRGRQASSRALRHQELLET